MNSCKDGLLANPAVVPPPSDSACRFAGVKLGNHNLENEVTMSLIIHWPHLFAMGSNILPLEIGDSLQSFHAESRGGDGTWGGWGGMIVCREGESGRRDYEDDFNLRCAVRRRPWFEGGPRVHESWSISGLGRLR